MSLPDSHRAWLAALGGAVLAAFTGFAARADAPAPAVIPSPSCVQTPAEYMTAFTSCLPVTCVSPKLYGTVEVGAVDGQSHIYPSGFEWAWTVGSESLLRFIAWHRQVCASPAKGPAFSNDVLLYVGFSQAYIDGGVRGQPINLAVMDLSEDPTLFVPTPAGWFEAMGREFGLQIPLETQKDVARGGENANSVMPLDANKMFAGITGCSLQGARNCSDEPLTSCSRTYADMARTLAPYSPYGDATTEECVAAFEQRLGGRPADAAQTRAMLYYCQDVNACNTGLGYGFNPAYPRQGGTAASHYTGPEFVVQNRSLASAGAVLTPLPTIP
ncbi:MAG: hypothetical protein AB7I59_05720 [Geminicoccaceae bacterium]